MIQVYAKSADDKSQSLANRLGVELVDEIGIDGADSESLYLEYRDGVLVLFAGQNPKATVCVDFWSHYLVMKKTNGLSRSTLLAKAAGARVGENRCLIDATAGLGRDSFVFAALGFQVQAFERSSVIGELLLDGIARAQEVQESVEFSEAMSRITVEVSECDQASLSANDVEVIYLDPMYPEKKKKALPKKEMQLLQQVAEETTNLEQLIEWSRQAAKSRVVVKRPPSAEPLAEITTSYNSKSVRFDCFVNNNC